MLQWSFSMYRTDVIKPLMEEWTTQKFLGTVRTFGDDRGLTNLLLRDGHDIIYLPEAKARTIVPRTFGVYVRQQLRWRRSFLMESISALGHMWKRPIGASLMFYIVLFLTMASPFVVSYFLIVGPIFDDFNPLVYIFGLTLIILLHQVFYWAFQLPPADKVGFFSFVADVTCLDILYSTITPLGYGYINRQFMGDSIEVNFRQIVRASSW